MVGNYARFSVSTLCEIEYSEYVFFEINVMFTKSSLVVGKRRCVGFQKVAC